MKKYVIPILLVVLMVLLDGCGQKPEESADRYSVTSDPMVSNIPDGTDEFETTPVVTTTTEPTTTPEVTTTPEPTTTPEVTTTPEPTTTPATTTTPESTTAATTTTKSTTTVTTTTKAATTVTTTTEATTTTSEPEPEVVNEPADVEEMAQCFLELLNEERAKAGVSTLVTGSILQEMAQVRANELPILLDHVRPDGRSYLSICTDYKYGIPTGYYGTYSNGEQYEIYYRENAGETVGMMDSTHSEVMIEGFRNSPGHWATLMDPTLGAVGVAVVAVEDQTYGYLYYYEVLLTDKLYE